MNMIEVQGTRSKEKPVAAQGRDKYEDKQESRLSHIPFYAGAALSALVLYLKESLATPASAQAAADDKPMHHPSSDGVHGGDDQLSAGDVAAAQASDGGLAAAADGQREADTAALRLPHGSLLVSDAGWYLGAGRYHGDSLDRQFQPVQSYSNGNADGAMNFPAIATNDNGVGGNHPRQAPEGQSHDIGPVVGSPSSRRDSTVAGDAPKKNHAPTVSGRVKLANEFTCTNFAILVAELLGKASDADGDTLSVKNVKINGVLLEQVDGHYTYHGETLGPVVVNYLVTDGQLSVAATAEIIFDRKPPIYGTDGDDTITGTACDDEISGGNGNDHIDGRGGDDAIYGGDGDDTINAGEGDDVIYGGNGSDTIYGGAGNDYISGGNGNDTLFGGLGNDIIEGGAGHDTMHGDAGDDVLVGDGGRDVIFDGAGKDRVDAGTGNDTVIAAKDAANDIFDGGDGTNKLSYASADAAVVFDLSHATVTGADIGHDQAVNFQVLEGGDGNDVFRTQLSSGTAADTVIRHAPQVYVPETDGTVVTQHAPLVYVPEHHDSEARASLDGTQVYGPSSANDAVSHADGNAASETAVSHADQGNSYLGGAGYDTIDYSAATQAIVIDLEHGTVQGAEVGTDFFASVESFVTGSGDDIFLASGDLEQHHMALTEAPDLPEGQPEDLGDSAQAAVDVTTNAMDLADHSGDAVSGAAANQHFSGGAGTDTLDYSAAENSVTIDTAGGLATGQDIGIDTFDGIEHFVGGAGADTFIIGSGTVVVDGGCGADVFQFVAATEDTAATLTIAHIEGFEVGDLVRMSMWDLFDQVETDDTDAFQNVYANQQDHSNGTAEPDLFVPIRVRIDGSGEHQSTYIDADLDQNGSYEITVQLDGQHHLTILNNHIA
jgi:Ca2+-binding RTX toxin-like protein